MSVLICVKSKHGCSSGMMSWTVSTSMWCFTFLSLLPAVGVGATISTTAVGILGIHGLEATWALRPNILGLYLHYTLIREEGPARPMALWASRASWSIRLGLLAQGLRPLGRGPIGPVAVGIDKGT